MGQEDIVPADQTLVVDYDQAMGLRKFANLPLLGFSLESELRKAVYSLKNMQYNRLTHWDSTFSKALLKDADGLCFLTVARAGAFVSGQVGTGLVICKRGDGTWGAPCAVTMIGTGIGPQLGVDVTDLVLIMKTQESISAFKGNHQLAVGGSIGLAVGPFGRQACCDLRFGTTRRLAVDWAYAASKGWFVGGSVEGSYLRINRGSNARFYGKPVESSELLSEDYPRPKAAQPLYDALEEVLFTTSPRTVSSTGAPAPPPAPSPPSDPTPTAAVTPTPAPTPTTDEADRTTIEGEGQEEGGD